MAMIIFSLILIASFVTIFGNAPIGEVTMVKYMVPFGYYQTGWFAVYLACGWVFSKEVMKKFGVMAGLLVFYLIFHGMWISIWWQNAFSAVDGVQQLGVRWQSAVSLMSLLVVVAPLVAKKYDRQDLIDLGGALAALFCIISSLRTVADFLFFSHCEGINKCGGTLMNPSQNAGFIVVTIPFMLKYAGRREWNLGSRILLSLAVCAVIVSKSSVAIGMLAVLIALNSAHLRKWRMLATLPAIAAAGIFLLGRTEFLSDGDRLPLWKMLGEAILIHPTNAIRAWGFGTGLGSVGVVTYGLQELFRFRENNWWAWAHNDWFEMLIATGLTGLLLLAGIYLDALRRFFLEREMHEVLSLVLFGILTFVNPTLHVGITALFGAWIVAAGLYREDAWSGQKLYCISQSSWPLLSLGGWLDPLKAWGNPWKR